MRPKIIAHRGASHLAPENTVAAFRLAAAMGVDGIEFDTLLTADNQLVVHHEYITDLHANANEVIPWCTLDQLRALDFGSWKSPLYAGEKIPTFAEALEACSDVDTHPGGIQVPAGGQRHHRPGRFCRAHPGRSGKLGPGRQDRRHFFQPRHPQPGEKAVSPPAGGGAHPQLGGFLPGPAPGPAPDAWASSTAPRPASWRKTALTPACPPGSRPCAPWWTWPSTPP